MARGKAGQLNPARLRELARAGAEQAVKQLRAEIVAIERTFPELALAKRRGGRGRALGQGGGRGPPVDQPARRTPRGSAAARKAVSDRMKKYWAERRKAQSKIK